SPMMTGTSFSILNYDTDFFELIKNGPVKIHIADIDRLSEGKVHLADEGKTVLETDAMLCVTGWHHTPPFKFLPEGIEREIGIPCSTDGGESGPGLAIPRLFKRADDEILSRFPMLADAPVFNKSYVPLLKQDAFSTKGEDPSEALSPMLLYHFMVPVGINFLMTKDLAFAGALTNFSNATCAYIEGLWISAFFDGKLARDPSDVLRSSRTTASKVGGPDWQPTLEKLQHETVLHNRFGKWRYPADHGVKFPDFVFEALPYMDMLMRDLGLQVRRKGGWWREVTEAYMPEDYADIDDEWNRKFGKTAELGEEAGFEEEVGI
ncbi:hypothetical protein IMZ48_48430, partial [Candidatus Bathyarchaeota archaeon]|nr:hypothetical protein [Candidatus Bathyarchaeota archaeon]